MSSEAKAVPAPQGDAAPDFIALSDQFMADEKLWPLGVNQKARRVIEGFAAWLAMRSVRGAASSSGSAGSPPSDEHETPALPEQEQST